MYKYLLKFFYVLLYKNIFYSIFLIFTFSKIVFIILYNFQKDFI